MFKLYQFDSLSSTNDYLKENHESYQDLDVILALTQSCGRGRFDRKWDSSNALTFSVLFEQSQVNHVFLSSLAIHYALSDLGIHSKIKWPNDILIDHKKVSGILIEQIHLDESNKKTIVGMGINMQMPDDIHLKDTASAVASHVRVSSIGLLSTVLQNYEKLLSQEEDEVYSQYCQHCILDGDVIIDDEVWSITGVNKEGHLIVSKDKDVKEIVSGEVVLHQRRCL